METEALTKSSCYSFCCTFSNDNLFINSLSKIPLDLHVETNSRNEQPIMTSGLSLGSITTKSIETDKPKSLIAGLI